MAATQTTVYQRDKAMHQAAWGRPLEDASREAGKYNVTYEQIHGLQLVPACVCFMSKRDVKQLPEPYRLEESLSIAVACDPGGRASLQTRFTTALAAGGDGSGDYEVVTPAVPGGWFGGGTPAFSTTHTLSLVQARPLIKACELVAATITDGGRPAAARNGVSTRLSPIFHHILSQVQAAIASTAGQTDQTLALADTAFSTILQNPAVLDRRPRSIPRQTNVHPPDRDRRRSI
jgi:hypothetical protein